jgi:hypothetical protein
MAVKSDKWGTCGVYVCACCGWVDVAGVVVPMCDGPDKSSKPNLILA